MEDLNLVVLRGRLAAPPERVTFVDGSGGDRYLVLVRSTSPTCRVDVLPVLAPGPPGRLERGDNVWMAAAIRRVFTDDTAGRRSRLQIVAHRVEPRGRSLDSRSPGDP